MFTCYGEYLKILFFHSNLVFSAAKQEVQQENRGNFCCSKYKNIHLVDSGVRGSKCGTTEFGEAGDILKSSCFIRIFGGKEEISVTVSSGVLSEISGFGGKSPFSLCSIKTFNVRREGADILDE